MRHPDFLNENSKIDYPFTEGALIDKDIILDLVVTVPDTFTLPFRVNKIQYSQSTLALSIVDDSGATVAVGSGVIDPDKDYTPIFFAGINASVSGAAQIGSEAFYSVSSSRIGVFTYQAGEIELEQSRINFFSTQKVDSISVDGFDDIAIGDVKFSGEGGLDISIDEENQEITFKVLIPESYTPECTGRCLSGECDPVAIRQFNNVLPDGSGNINITGDGIVVPSVSGESSIVIGTPQVTINDICDNKTQPSPGKPGPPGPKGPKGDQGLVITNDCQGRDDPDELNDEDQAKADQCENFFELPPDEAAEYE